MGRRYGRILIEIPLANGFGIRLDKIFCHILWHQWNGSQPCLFVEYLEIILRTWSGCYYKWLTKQWLRSKALYYKAQCMSYMESPSRNKIMSYVVKYLFISILYPVHIVKGFIKILSVFYRLMTRIMCYGIKDTVFGGYKILVIDCVYRE